MKINKDPSSFRDPSGFIFQDNKTILRQINRCYKDDYDFLMHSGLYVELSKKKLLIAHKEIPDIFQFPDSYKVIKPHTIPFISYPYEWSFSQLKDAALLTLEIQKEALGFKMCLKDASPFNIQFLEGKPVLIDTLSFEKYIEGKPWVAYRQFCEQFLSPLSLMSYKDIRLGKLMQEYISGIPLDLTSKLLPNRSKFNPLVFIHLYLHAKSQKKFTRITSDQKNKQTLNRNALYELIDSLETGIKKLRPKQDKTVWTNYYNDYHPSYTDKSKFEKKSFVEKYLKAVKPKTLLDIGANTGEYSQISGRMNISTISVDYDPTAVEQNYEWIKLNNEKNILPLWIDILNPPPAVGWKNKERKSFLDRMDLDVILALALIHHLAISNNIPLSYLADFFSQHCNSLIIEFVPKSDPQVEKLLENRRDIFADYHQGSFEKEFTSYFKIIGKFNLSGCGRVLYCMRNKKTV